MKRTSALVVLLCALATPVAIQSALAQSASTAPQSFTITGKVEAYEKGMSLTVLRSDGARLTFVITATSQIPSDLAVGKKINLNAMGNEVKSISYAK